MNYEDHAEVLKLLEIDRAAEYDLRREIAEQIGFINHPQGQWEPEIWSLYEGRPRYTFNQAKAHIGKAWAEMAANDYAAITQPVGQGADEDKAKVISGLMRAIYSWSSFEDISTRQGKRMIGTGFGCWRAVSTIKGESFNQDLELIAINNAHERAYFDSSSEMQTREDGSHGWVLQSLTLDSCKSKWPGRDGQFGGIGEKLTGSTYNHKNNSMILVGEILYKKPTRKTIYLLSSGEVVSEISEYSDVEDEREVEVFEVYSRRFDNNDWLDKEPKKTVFDLIPLIPCYANFDIAEDKATFHGMLRDIMDPCKIFNYVESRKVEEAVLSRPDQLMVSAKQVKGREGEYGDINRDPRRVRVYSHDENAPPPYVVPGSQPSMALTEISGDMVRDLQLITGINNNLTDAEASKRDSDFRGELRSGMGQLGTYEYYRGWQVALEHTAKILLGAIPKVYDTERAIMIVDEAKQPSEVEINKNVNGEIENDLTVGKYDVSIKISDAMESRQARANDGILEMAQYDPTIVQVNADLLASNIDAPGMQAVSERLRARGMQAGAIPQGQWTDEEKQQAQLAAQQPKEKTPEEKIGDAEIRKSESMAMKAQYDALGKHAELELKDQEQASRVQLQALDLQLRQKEQDIKEQESYYNNLLKLSQSIENLQNTGQNIDNATQTVKEGSND